MTHAYIHAAFMQGEFFPHNYKEFYTSLAKPTWSFYISNIYENQGIPFILGGLLHRVHKFIYRRDSGGTRRSGEDGYFGGRETEVVVVAGVG